MANVVRVIDISHWQPTPDFPTVKNKGGVLAVILKATQGTSYVDDTWRSRRDAAVKAGLAYSTYHFFEKGNVTKQMDHYLNTIKPVQGERVCIDHEPNSDGSSPSLADLEQAVTYLLSKRPDLQITVYSGHLIKEQLGSNHSSVLAANTSLWLAQYSTTPSWPKGTWAAWSLWQFTDKATVPGIQGNVDGNEFNGSDEQLLKWFGPASALAPAEPDLPDEPGEYEGVYLDLTIPDNVPYSIVINGNVIASRETA